MQPPRRHLLVDLSQRWTKPHLALVCVALLFASCHHSSGGLDGGYVKTQMTAYSSGLLCTYYVFFSDGTMYFGLPANGGASFDYSALHKADPKNCGTFRLEGQKLTMTHDSGGAPEVHSYTPAAGGMMDSCPFSAVWRFDDGARLEGKWGIDTAFRGQGYNTSASTTFIFHKDGTFEGSSHAGVDGRPSTALTTTNGKGTYAFKGGKVSVKYSDGATKSWDIYGTNAKATPYVLRIDGIDYSPTR